MPMQRDRYPSDWEVISKRIRFERGGNKCEWCGAENYQPHPITGGKVILTVAHYPDSDPMNCAEDNLHALCQRCHNRADAPMRTVNARRTRLQKQEEKIAESGQLRLL
jgi:5-methylcytosine-specific restriction endonuclease McrA